MATKDTKHFKQYLKDIEKILEWFDAQEELDVEEALKKVKEASELIRGGKELLKEAENEFTIIKKEIGG